MKSLAMLTVETMIADQHFRNRLSLMACALAFLCGWIMFLSAKAVVGAQITPADTAAQPTVVSQK